MIPLIFAGDHPTWMVAAVLFGPCPFFPYPPRGLIVGSMGCTLVPVEPSKTASGVTQSAEKIINQLEEEGWNLVFTDGSAKHYPTFGWVAGYGCVWMGKWETKGYLHPSIATIGMNSKQSSQCCHISKALMSG